MRRWIHLNSRYMLSKTRKKTSVVDSSDVLYGNKKNNNINSNNNHETEYHNFRSIEEYEYCVIFPNKNHFNNQKRTNLNKKSRQGINDLAYHHYSIPEFWAFSLTSASNITTYTQTNCLLRYTTCIVDIHNIVNHEKTNIYDIISSRTAISSRRSYIGRVFVATSAI